MFNKLRFPSLLHTLFSEYFLRIAFWTYIMANMADMANMANMAKPNLEMLKSLVLELRTWCLVKID